MTTLTYDFISDLIDDVSDLTDSIGDLEMMTSTITDNLYDDMTEAELREKLDDLVGIFEQAQSCGQEGLEIIRKKLGMTT